MHSRMFAGVLLFMAFFVLAELNSVGAQSSVNSTGTGGIHTIRGKIYLPNGKTFDTPISVELQSTTFTALTLFTDRNGGFSFQALAPGNYSIVVNAGDSFDTAREYVTIDGEVQGSIRFPPIPKTVTIPIYLQEKRVAAQKNGVISAKWAGVPDAAMDHYRKGIRLVQDKKTDEAIAEFQKSLELYPSFSLPHTELGKIFLTTGRLDDAVSSFRNAVRFDQADFEAALSLGIALLNKKEFAEAEKTLNTAAELNKTAVTPRYYLGVLYIEKKDLDSAQKEMEAAKKLMGDKSFPLLHRYLGGIYVAKHLDKLALVELEAYIQLAPNAKDADRIRQTIADLRSKQN